jgi:hypothetical protein
MTGYTYEGNKQLFSHAFLISVKLNVHGVEVCAGLAIYLLTFA